ncbi:MAG: hypothetical protein AB8B50_17380 [Pirellulaceae bacterium]
MLLTVDYGYDAFDQRVSKRVDEIGDTASDRDEVFVWADGQEVLRFLCTCGHSTPLHLRTQHALVGRVL